MLEREGEELQGVRRRMSVCEGVGRRPRGYMARKRWRDSF